jgi:two-component system, sensor histidine kinase and response regulator
LSIFRRTDRMFAGLMPFQWLAGLILALWLSPRVRNGAESYIHPHVWAALVIGGIIALPSVSMALFFPGRRLTRHLIAVAQLLTSALLIHLSGGRIETHFHVFGSLAFLAFYRDWPVLISATMVVAIDHIVRGTYWPQLVYGVDFVQPWRWVEQTGWVLFEDGFLFYSIVQSLHEMRAIADRQASLEATNNDIERQVTQRTEQLNSARATLEAKVAELDAAQTTLRQVIEACPDCIVVARASDGAYLSVNEGFTRQLGYTPQEAYACTYHDLNPYAEKAELEAVTRRLFEDGVIQSVEVNLRRKDGTVVPQLVSAVLTKIGPEDCIVSFTRDITEIKRTEQRLRAEVAERQTMEQKLRESEGTLRQVIETSPDSIVVLRAADMTYLSVNEAFTRQLGFSPQEVLGKSFIELGIYDDTPRRAEVVQRLNEERVIQGMEYNLRRKDGTMVPLSISIVLTKIGAEDCLVAFTRDISEIKRTEEKLRAEIAERQNIERKLREREVMLGSIIDTSPNCISLTRLSDGAHVLVNDAWVKQLGFLRDEAIGRSARELGIWTDLEQVQLLTRQLRENSVVSNVEIYLQHKKGSVIPYLGSFALSEIGSEQYVVSIGHDITEIKRTEHELVHAREAALAASKAKSEFLSSMSHEIRTPMNAVLGMADLLAESSLDADQRRYLDVMIANGNSLLALINDILDLAKIEAGRLQIEQIDLNLIELIEATVASFGQRAHAKGLELTARIAPGVPDGLVGDPLRLRQILINLLGNAVKFTNSGEVRLVVQPNPDSDKHADLLFSVEDTGIGIPGDRLGEIFRSFTQVDSSTTRQYGGSGLGLTIVKRIVELMNGRIWVESTVGAGSKFSFTLPLGVAVKPPRDELLPLPDLKGWRVLVVDDIATNRMIVREMLASRGAMVDEVDCGADALKAVKGANSRGRPYQIILLDMRMPGMDGLEASRLIRGEHLLNEPLILMLSSDDLKPQLARIRESGLDRYLVKPITRRELFSTIAGVMGQTSDKLRTSSERPFDASVNGAETQARALSILIADDAADNRLLVAAYLKREPYNLDFAENGKVALEKFIAGHYDLVLMDLHMPVMDGYETTGAIRQVERERNLRHTPILALTASVFEEDVGEALAAGCDEHVPKPVKKAALLQVVQKYIGEPESVSATPLASTTERAA